METETPLSLDEWLEYIQPAVEADLDAQIASAPEDLRRGLRHVRPLLLSKMMDNIHIINLQRQLAEAQGFSRGEVVH